ncbi:acetolactate synthase catalytic subunit, mitochondrial [Trichomonascus vanleenenianus]|uniref:acetolactate synthase catalytic subunit n=1 Tax=Trichomonascus vanleenenianus TaxID=2268995 RepID=UPI003ECA0147
MEATLKRYISKSSNKSASLSSYSQTKPHDPTISRPRPAPSFNTEVDEPTPAETPANHAAMDDSFIGLTGGQIFHEMMLRHNVDTIFGYSGGAILPVFDGIYNSPHFKFILPRHEQGAGHMAEGYARATGKTGVVIVTSGPGATNVVTPMQDALSDGTPMVVITGQVATRAIGTDAFQEADVVGITRSCTKWNVMVKNLAELPRRLNEAFEIANSGRPGPVLVDLPKDISGGMLQEAIPTESTLPSKSLAHLSALAVSQFQQEAIKRSAALINGAKRPIIYAGNGVIQSEEGSKLLRELAYRANIPVTTTLHGLGAFDENDPLALHMLGMHGSAYANRAIQQADVIIALGARFDERVTGAITKFAPAARLAALEGRGGIIHFEILPKNINKVVEATEAIEGDVGANLAKLLPMVKPVEKSVRSEWLNKIAEWKEKYPFDYEKDAPGERIRPQTVIKALSKLTSKIRDKTIITTGVGQHQMWAAQFFRFTHPRSLATSGGLGTMGYGLPAAIGAKVGRPDATVIDIDGDASFNMTLTELSTAAQFNIGIKAVVLNNEEQGMVTQWQSLFYEDRYSHTHQLNPDYMKLADATGVTGIRIEKLEDLEAGLQKMLDTEGPVLCEVIVDQKVPVLPMVPAGKGLDECLVYDETVEQERKKLREERLARLQAKGYKIK